jgi:hypothetical protein
MLYSWALSTSAHAVVEIARALDQLFDSTPRLFDDACGNTPGARDR